MLLSAEQTTITISTMFDTFEQLQNQLQYHWSAVETIENNLYFSFNKIVEFE